MTPCRFSGIAAGLFFNGFLAISVLDLPKSACYAVVTGFGLAVSFVGLSLLGWQINRDIVQRWLTMFGLFSTILGVSYAVNFDAYEFSLTFKVLGYFTMFALSTGMAVLGGWRGFRTCMVTHWGGLWLAMILTLVVNNVNPHNGRLHGPFKKHDVQTSGLHANEVGMLGLTAVLVSIGVGPTAVVATAPAGFYIASLSGCRGAMIGIVLGLITYLFAREFIAGSRWRVRNTVPVRGLWLLAGLLVVCVLAGTTGASAIVDRLLLLSDERRGLSSGFTGRLDQWAGMLEHWQQNPVFGRGYSIVREDALSEANNADGGFLLATAELGILGLLYFCGLFAGSIRNSLLEVARSGDAKAVTCLVFMVVFGFTNLFESRIMGTGSIGLGIFFYVSALCLIVRDRDLQNADPVPYSSIPDDQDKVQKNTCRTQVLL
ncbi:MAG: O-antigen ligase family protein [Planctomycetaceae bacterium]